MLTKIGENLIEATESEVIISNYDKNLIRFCFTEISELKKLLDSLIQDDDLEYRKEHEVLFRCFNDDIPF